MERETGHGAGTIGALTYADLACADVFGTAQAKDAWGVLRAPFSPELARMSAELAANVYELRVHPWARAGFVDCTFVIEDRVIVLDRDGDSKLRAMETEWKRYRAKSLLRGVRPIGDLLRAARQFMVTDMGKSVVMARTLPDGRAVIAISFIGTTEKFYDWFSNFKLPRDRGMHQGFLELARQFDAQAGRVSFPALALALGRDALTLEDILERAKDPDSPFVFWLSGHSQGGALVQTYTHLLMARGVPAGRILSYSFAAPTVAVLGEGMDPKAYPIYNLVNTDDMAPRLGAQVRLGMDLLFFPDDAFRQAHYKVHPEIRAGFDRVLFLAEDLCTTADALCFGVSLMRMARAAHADPGIEAFFLEAIPGLSMLRRIGLGLPEMAQFLEPRLLEHCRALSGAAPDEAVCALHGRRLQALIADLGPKKAARALRAFLHAPHRLRPDKKDETFVPPYLAMVRRHLWAMSRGVWDGAFPPRCLDARDEVLLPRNAAGK